MTFDLSRVRFDARKDFLGVVMQQGRVQLDSDWNEWVAELVRRIQSGTLDTLGTAAVPRETPHGFSIQAGSGKLSIGIGRIYVDGVLAENHGIRPDAESWTPSDAGDRWDRSLAEEAGQGPVDYHQQPYRPDLQETSDLPEDGTHLVYLDVWRREVTPLQDPELVESAVGVDTTGRLQTVWQVKILEDVGDITCQTEKEDIPGWVQETRVSQGRLSSDTGEPPEDEGPCQVPPQAGYRGLENQLYRVEIHKGGGPGTATFKWSRDNATVASGVTHINPSRDQLTVESIGRDEYLRFNDGDWVEVTDDWRELKNLPGLLRRIHTHKGVDENAGTLTLDDPLPGGAFPVDGQNRTASSRHTRVKRWDQSGKVYKENGEAYWNLDEATAEGDIPVPADGTRLFLEDGILVEFDVVEGPGGGQGEFRSLDHWVMAARNADGTVESLFKAPPLGIHHHYAPLAVVTFPDSEMDCRVLWPPLHEGESCDCTVCVRADGHNQGTATIQQAIDQIGDEGGTICLGPGTFRIRDALNVAGASSIRIRGQGWRTVLLGEAPGRVLEISNSTGVALENFTLLGSGSGSKTTAAVAAANVVDLVLDHVNVVQVASGRATGVALEASGYLVGCQLRDSVLVGDLGFSNAGGKRDFLLAAELRSRNNVFFCRQRGFSFEGVSLHAGTSSLTHNLLLGCSDASIVTMGGVLGGSTFTVADNVVFTSGTGVRAGVDGLRVERNEITGSGEESGDGVSLEPGLDPARIDTVCIMGNRIQRLGGSGVAVRHGVGHLLIKQNLIRDVGRAGVTMEATGSATDLVIENNHFSGLGGGVTGEAVFGALQVAAVERLDVLDNIVERIALDEQQPIRSVAGLLAVGIGEGRIAGNRIHGFDLGVRPPPGTGLLAIPLVHLAVIDNAIRRSGDETMELDEAEWYALSIGIASFTGEEAPVFLGARFAYGVFEKQAFYLSASRVHFFQRPDPAVAVRGNRFHGEEGAAPLVRVAGVESCLFSENWCRFTGQVTEEAQVAHLVGRGVNASHNRLLGLHGQEGVVLAIESQAGQDERPPVVVLGNTSTGRIRVNGAELGPPWADLNVSA